MIGTAWIYGGLLALGLLHLLMTWQLVRRGSDASGAPEAADGRSDTHANGAESTVRCRECDAVNAAGYQFCRACVAELPGGDDSSPPGAPSRAGSLL